MRIIKASFYTLFFLLVSTGLYVAYGAYLNTHTPANQQYSNPLEFKKTRMPESGIELKLLTYNVANAHGFTTNQRERIDAVADLLLELDVDIAGLQEVFIEADRKYLLQKLATTGLQYAAEFPAGYLGNGLVILSKYPIEESFFHRFKANNPWWKVWEGDWWAGKGIGHARIKLQEHFYIDFYNVHAQAYRGNQASHDVRYLQYQEAANFLNQSALKDAPVFFVGDFNTERGFPDYEFVMKNANLKRIMNMDSDIDHITAVNNPDFHFEVLDTQEIFRQIVVPYPGDFYSRAPTPLEFWNMHFAESKKEHLSHISDHPGYLSHIRITPTKP